MEKAFVPSEVSRPASYSNVYTGSFKDKSPAIRPAGILTYAPGENVKQSLRYVVSSVDVLPNVDKFHHYATPDMGEIRIHYGRANDPKTYEKITHGMKSGDKQITTKDCVNPPLPTKFESLKHEISEMVYKSKKAAPLGRVPSLNLPKHIDPYKNTFGMKLNRDANAKECINPDKDRPTVELESTAKHDQYIKSHCDYEPGERKSRKFHEPFSDNTRFGKRTEALFDGTMAKRSMSWMPQTLLERRNQIDSKVLDDFREKHTTQIGKTLDPNKETRFLGPDHVFGLTNNSEPYNAADIMHGRNNEKILKGKERERAYIAALRSYLSGYNHTKFKTIAEAFKFYDKDKDGFISKDELRFASAAANFPLGLDLVDALLEEYDYDKDGKLNFLEFANFLCFKETMKLGIKVDPNAPDDEELRDDEGRVLLKKSDLMHKNNIAVNELVPRTIVTQLDTKIGSWKSTYDIINDAPFREEPLKKRVYGVPSIRNDLIPPTLKKIQDRANYGNDGNVWSLVSPSIFTQHGVYEKDVLKPRTKDEVKKIFKSIGNELPDDLFDHIWEEAQSKNPYGEVSVEEFRSVLGRFTTKKLQSESNNEVICS